MEKVSEEAAKAWMEEGRQKGKMELLIFLYKDGKITAESAAKYLNISAEEFLKLAEE